LTVKRHQVAQKTAYSEYDNVKISEFTTTMEACLPKKQLDPSSHFDIIIGWFLVSWEFNGTFTQTW